MSRLPATALSETPKSRSSRLSGFHRLSIEERRETIQREGWIPPSDVTALAAASGFDVSAADAMSENVLGIHGLPFAVGLNFRINGRDLLAPMSVEEPSVVAAASNAARLALAGGGFTADADEPHMIAQVQLLRLDDAEAARKKVLQQKQALIEQANGVIPQMVRRGGGVRDVEVRVLRQDVAVVHLIIDTRDAMGANLLNTVAEMMAAPIQQLTGGEVGLRILSNLADRRCVRVEARYAPTVLAMPGFSGEEVRDSIVSASQFAEMDPYRACTHNKGIMNGVDAVVLATGNDWRAVEAGAHAYAARSGHYAPLAVWSVNERGELVGRLEMPLALGIVGGAVRAHPGVRLALRLAGVSSATELAMLAGAVGLASNFAALRALGTEGIQRGHMSLHARSVAAEVGAVGGEIEAVALELARNGDYRPERARAELQKLRLGLVVHE
jgi:hydroxymethylglutaryl-CoA reductase